MEQLIWRRKKLFAFVLQLPLRLIYAGDDDELEDRCEDDDDDDHHHRHHHYHHTCMEVISAPKRPSIPRYSDGWKSLTLWAAAT